MNEHPPEALLLIAPDCVYCPAMLQAMADLVKRTKLARLEVVNIVARPEVAQRLGVRSVPWVRIGAMEFSGARSAAELERWVERAGTGAGLSEYFAETLKTGGLSRVIDHINRDPTSLDALLALVANSDAELHVHVGVGAVIEEFAGSDMLRARVPLLGALTHHNDARVRADACHYLALCGSADALPFVRHLLHDSDAQVREIAQESLASLSES